MGAFLFSESTNQCTTAGIAVAGRLGGWVRANAGALILLVCAQQVCQRHGDTQCHLVLDGAPKPPGGIAKDGSLRFGLALPKSSSVAGRHERKAGAMMHPFSQPCL